MELTPYLNFNGTCAEAFKFYEQVLGGRIEFLQTHGDSPAKDHVPAAWQDKVMHVSMKVGQYRLMGSDAPPEHFEPAKGLYISISVPTVDDGQRIFTALSENGKVTMPFGKTFWSDGFAMLTDRYGTPWMINVGQQ